MFGSSLGRKDRLDWAALGNWFCAIGVVLSIGLVSAPSFAQQDAQVKAKRAAAARALFNEARELMQSGRAAQACPKFEESLRLEPGLGTRFNLADCWQNIDRTASAWSLFLDVASEARANNQTERAEVAAERAEALEPQLSYVIITVPNPRDGQSVWLGNVELGRGAWGSRWPVDKGAHELRTEAPGYTSVSQTLRVTQSGDIISVTLPQLDRSTTGKTNPSSQVAAETTSAEPIIDEPPPEKSRADTRNTARTIGVPTLLVLGLAGGGLGTYFIVHRNNLNTRAEGLCLDSSCSRSEFEHHAALINDAESSQTRGVVSFAVGGACLVGAALWYFLGDDADSSTTSFNVNPLNGISVSYRRAW